MIWVASTVLKEGEIRPTVSIPNSFRRLSRRIQIKNDSPVNASNGVKLLEPISLDRRNRIGKRWSYLSKTQQSKVVVMKKEKKEN
ncbi:hypothetical protein F2Q69_00058652 [Brassica cretica]|uniref:Uncharacterized protein n=1 Tax=Brassica cretica TaxID=69181 RepID=A0A8S9RKY2_BRACR|nr:hypothetical protein F2Q69_00058652 [Brassica cretica]